MMYIIAKQTVRTLNMNQISMCVSNTIHVCHGSNNHGIYTLIQRHQKYA